MNKTELIDVVATAVGLSKTSANQAIDVVIDAITKSLKKGEQVVLVGFGTFSTSRRKARTGRNPRSGQTINISARTVAKFTPGKKLKEAVNTNKG